MDATATADAPIVSNAVSTVVWNDEPEMFYFLTYLWDVRAAKRLLREKKRPAKIFTASVAELRVLVGGPPKKLEGGRTTISMGIRVDWDLVREDMARPVPEQRINLDVPVIIAKTPSGNDMPIDGYHRIGKAILLERETLPCVVLSAADSRKIYVK